MNLSCSGISNDDNLEVAIQKIDEKLCAAGGDYTTYTFNCLPTWFGRDITNQADFVDAITGYACAIQGALELFTNITFINYQDEVNDRFIPIEVPGTTCTSANVNPTDTLQLVLEKYCSKFGQLDEFTDISGVVWDNCQTVFSTPSTIGEALQLLADQICNIVAGDLPTFDTTGTCLATPLSSNETLEDTVNKILVRICESPTWDSNNVNWGCVGGPSDSTNLEEAIQNIVDVISTLQEAKVTFDTDDFIVTATSPSDVCQGVTVALATPINQDRFVAATAGDASPGTLQSKLVAGTGITLDYTNPIHVTINASGTADSFEVKADSTDPTHGALSDKINGSSTTGASLDATYNSGTEQLDLNLSIDADALFDRLLDRLIVGSALYQKFCEKVAGCPSPCSAPTNVQAVAGTIPSTSTTTLP